MLALSIVGDRYGFTIRIIVSPAEGKQNRVHGQKANLRTRIGCCECTRILPRRPLLLRRPSRTRYDESVIDAMSIGKTLVVAYAIMRCVPNLPSLMQDCVIFCYK